MTKPHYGRIKNGTRIPIDPASSTGLGYRIYGEFLDHPEFRTTATTSEVVSCDETTGEIETRNSRYTLVTEGVAQRYMDFPMVGDKVRFLNKNGYDHERVDALQALGTQRLYTVTAIHIGDWKSHIVLDDGSGHGWNTVMFEIVERADQQVMVMQEPPYSIPDSLIEALTGERQYQIDRWGSDENKSINDFVVYMDAYLHHVKMSMTANNPVNPDGMHIMRKITALGIACMERHGIVKRG